MEWIIQELHIFFCAVWTGCIFYNIYGAIRIIRSIVKHSDLIISIEDFIYWIFVGFYGFSEIFQMNKGVIRGYVIIGIVVGSLCTYIIWCGAKKAIINIKKSLKNGIENRMM